MMTDGGTVPKNIKTSEMCHEVRNKLAHVLNNV